MARFGRMIACFVFATILYTASADYPPAIVPFEEYGPPTRTGSEILSPVLPSTILRSPVRQTKRISPKVVPKVIVDSKPVDNKLIDSQVRTLPEGKIVVPPNSNIQLRDAKNQYSHGFQSPDGTEIREQGRLISTDDGWEYVIAKTGSYKYTSPEGKIVDVEWIADEKGFRIVSSTI